MTFILSRPFSRFFLNVCAVFATFANTVFIIEFKNNFCLVKKFCETTPNKIIELGRIQIDNQLQTKYFWTKQFDEFFCSNKVAVLLFFRHIVINSNVRLLLAVLGLFLYGLRIVVQVSVRSSVPDSCTASRQKFGPELLNVTCSAIIGTYFLCRYSCCIVTVFQIAAWSSGPKFCPCSMSTKFWS